MLYIFVNTQSWRKNSQCYLFFKQIRPDCIHFTIIEPCKKLSKDKFYEVQKVSMGGSCYFFLIQMARLNVRSFGMFLLLSSPCFRIFK